MCCLPGGDWVLVRLSIFNFQFGTSELEIENGKLKIEQPGRQASWLAWLGYWLGSWLVCCLPGGDWVLVRPSIFNFQFGT